MYTHYQHEPASSAVSGGLQRWLSIAIAGVFLAVSLMAVAAWYVKSSQLLSVQSASMAPLIQIGDAVLVEKVTIDELRLGDVISFYNPDSNAGANANTGATIVTHRVVGLDLSARSVQTRGDSNATADQPIDQSLLVGRVTRLLPNVGYILDFVHSRAGLAIGVYLPAAIIVFAELRRLTAYYNPGYHHPSRV